MLEYSDNILATQPIWEYLRQSDKLGKLAVDPAHLILSTVHSLKLRTNIKSQKLFHCFHKKKEISSGQVVLIVLIASTIPPLDPLLHMPQL